MAIPQTRSPGPTRPAMVWQTPELFWFENLIWVNNMNQIEFTTEISPDGHIVLPDDCRTGLATGFKVKVVLQPLFSGTCVTSMHAPETRSERDAGAGSISGKERDIKPDMKPDTADGSSSAANMLMVAAEDWLDWADSTEDIYEDFRHLINQR